MEEREPKGLFCGLRLRFITSKRLLNLLDQGTPTLSISRIHLPSAHSIDQGEVLFVYRLSPTTATDRQAPL